MEQEKDYSSKREQALEACNKVINGIEDGNITVSSSLLMCRKIARLVNDLDGMEWLEYEYGGYPRGKNGFILDDAWQIASTHGRLFHTKDTDGKPKIVIFADLCGELETSIESYKKAISNYSTQGYSASGNRAAIATYNMVSSVASKTGNLLNTIRDSERRLSILKSQYYDYALRWQIELQFGNAAKTTFDYYQERVDGYFSLMPTTTLQKLNSIEEMMNDDNPERYSQVITSCRRLWSEVAKTLFDEEYPDYIDKFYKTKSGKEIDITGDHDNNKLSAVIEKLQSKAAKNTLVGSETINLIDWLEQINNMQNTGVHSNITREQASQCIIHTYVALGDILSLKAMAKKQEKKS